jgi:hypothetical protein
VKNGNAAPAKAALSATIMSRSRCPKRFRGLADDQQYRSTRRCREAAHSYAAILRQQAARLGNTPNHEKDETFRTICAAVRAFADPLYHGSFAEQLFLTGKTSLINRSDDGIRATVISELNKIEPISLAQDKPDTESCATAETEPSALSTVLAAGKTSRATAEPIIKIAADLQNMTFAPLKYIVPELIVEGCVLLAGRPKVGKSWLALDVGIAIATGRYCLGERKPAQGRVLYLALEDGDRRMQRRITKLLPTFKDRWPETFEYATQWPRADQGGAEEIDKWCEDYAALSKLQELATRRSITILVVHHTRKGLSDDPVEEIPGHSGSRGLPTLS